MANRYAEDIRDIVGIDNSVKGGLGDTDSRVAVPAARGTAQINSSTSVIGSSGTPGQETPPGGEDGEKETPGDTIGEELGNQAGGYAESTFDMASLLDGELDGLFPGDSLGPDSDVPSEAGRLGGLDGMTDCASGDTMEFRMDGEYPPVPEGTDSTGVPFTEWLDPDTPPPLPGYTSGYRWTYSGNYKAVPGELIPIIEAALDAATPANAPYKFSEWTSQGESTWNADFTHNSGTTNEAITRGTCTVGVDAGCDATAPTPLDWGTDDNIAFRFKDGQFQTSQYDPDVPQNFVDPQGSVDFCYTGGGTGTIEPLLNGGFAVYKTSGGAVDGVARIFNAEGQMTAATDSVGIDAYRVPSV